MNKLINIFIGSKIKCYNGTTGFVTDIISSCEVQLNFTLSIHITDIKWINDNQLIEDPSDINLVDEFDSCNLIFFKKSGKYYTDVTIKVKKNILLYELLDLVSWYPYYKDHDLVLIGDNIPPHLIKSTLK